MLQFAFDYGHIRERRRFLHRAEITRPVCSSETPAGFGSFCNSRVSDLFAGYRAAMIAYADKHGGMIEIPG